jgi:uncharacterized glyoxalase superfamily protein PhnB
MSKLPANRSVPAARLIPVLAYPDVREAVRWLTETFGFTERLQIAVHRSQMVVADGAAVIIAEYIDRERRPVAGADHVSHQIMVRVPDVDAHHDRSVAKGARIIEPPTSHPYGERQYMVQDPGGHRWMFSQTLFDVHPNDWGDEEVILKG